MNYTGRTIVGQTQKHPEDFALWKFVDENSLQKWRFGDFTNATQDNFNQRIFDLMVGVGEKRTALDNQIYAEIEDKWGCPGWHSECVAMISEIIGKKRFSRQEFSFTEKVQEQILDLEKNSKLNQTPTYEIDLHFGGEDHVQVHHKNEIEQSEALGFHLSKNWVHNKFVLVNGKKMSKSLGNVYLVDGKQAETGFYSFENPPIHEFSEELKSQIIKKYKEMKLYEGNSSLGQTNVKGFGLEVQNKSPLGGQGGVLAEQEYGKDSSTSLIEYISNLPRRYQKLGILPYNQDLVTKAKELRQNSSPMEIRFWCELKNDNVLKQINFDRQKPILNYILDFYLPQFGIGIELDGESHNHQLEYDILRTKELENLGIKILRFNNEDIQNNLDGVFGEIKKILQADATDTPQPPKGGQEQDTFWQSFHFDPLAFRLMCFEHHYSEQMNFTWGKLWQSQMRLWGMRKEAAKIESFIYSDKIDRFEGKDISETKSDWITLLTDNLNFVEFLEKYAQFITNKVNQTQAEKSIFYEEIDLIADFDKHLLQFKLFSNYKVISEIMSLGNLRQKAKLAKDYQKSDQIRTEIQALGWQIDDYSWGWGVWWRG